MFVMVVAHRFAPLLPGVGLLAMTDAGVPGISERLVDGLNATFGVHPGSRAAHAKGVLCAAVFEPSTAAAGLSRAAHFADGPQRAHVRFSNGSGNPEAPDGTRDGRGIGLKIYGHAGTTDIVGLSLPSFFTRTPEDLLEFNQARRPDPATGAADPAKVGAYLAEHPEAMPAVTAAVTHPIPATFAALTFNSIHAFGFVDARDQVRWGRYQFQPEANDDALSDEEAAARPADYLAGELRDRLAAAPVRFGLDVILAEEGDDVDDPTVAWPAERERIRIGTIAVTGLADDREHDGDILVFDPTRVLDGIVLSRDPILLARPGAYSVSVARRTTP
jgi:catalase